MWPELSRAPARATVAHAALPREITGEARHLPLALQRTSEFVGRTQNWLYDHLKWIPNYRLYILCDALENRQEFPLLEARLLRPRALDRRLWYRLFGPRLYPRDHRLLRLLGPVLLHSHFGYVARGDLHLADQLHLPWIVSFYGADLYQLGRRPDWVDAYGRVFLRASLVLALGPSMASRLRELSCPRQKIAVHPLGVDLENLPYRPRTRRPDQPIELLFAGTFREKKGAIYLVQAAALARRSGVRLRLTLVGDAAGKSGDLEAKRALFREIDRLGLDACVTHLPFLPFQDLLALALRSHLFVLPSVTAEDGDAEGTPFVLQQMMATGMPAIATYHSDIPFIFGEYSHLLVPERDALAIARRIEEYASCTHLLTEHGISLASRIRTEFDASRQAKHLADLYDRVRNG